MSSRVSPGNTSKQNWQEALARLAGAYSPATIRAYHADFAAFEKVVPVSRVAPLPARPSTGARFVEVDAKRSAASTLNCRLSAI